MARFANKTFFRFLFGFLIIISISFIAIMGTNQLAAKSAENNTAQVSEDVECAEGGDC